ncbi:MAG: tRNA uridine-5-carboxymethylaminomethyl(34) synthesis GTPase MnmE [Bacteroidales bacterium]|jgi:tRNA modification GTPase|nr:tRNA uridine-5-carboxymethylaminomethyl(34) synthesis GTPase MnmE [Bacteroidales bacterium]
MFLHPQDTICAVSTPPGQGGIAVIRISGGEAFRICSRIFEPATKALSGDGRGGASISLGRICRGHEVIDEALVTVFHAPRSYTGEDTVEISCHGSLYIQREILRLLLLAGCRMAAAGEFTQRAFLNGKLDLSQAEAVGDLIAASSAASHRVAMQQMRGGFSHELDALRDRLLNFVALVELELDFGDEDAAFADRRELKELSGQIAAVIRRLADSFGYGNAVKNGIPVAIVGETNAGKSTLLNRLLRDEKAIVSEVHGTTRDAIEDTVTVDGLLFRLIDTAGIRETNDTVEQMGIERALRKMEQASVVLWVIDLTGDVRKTGRLAAQIAARRNGKKLLLILNKADRLTDGERERKTAYYSGWNEEYLVISAREDADIAALERKLVEAAGIPQIGENDVTVTSLRHYEALVKALSAIERVTEGLYSGIFGEFLSQDIRECISHLNGITGKQIGTEEVLGNIFGRFCIGK